MPYAHLGEALATDSFLVREQFSHEEWRHFLRTREFVDHEVLPQINEYHAQPIQGKGSVRAIWQADITLDDVRVQLENRLPGTNTSKDTGRVLVTTRGVCAWAALGHAMAAYDTALTYAQQLARLDLLANHVMRHLADIEAIHTFEGTETLQALIVGRDITGIGAFR